MVDKGVSVILPVFNDNAALQTAIPRSIAALSEISPAFEIIVAEDGSTDGSAEHVRQLAIQDPRIRLLHSDKRLGRGTALNRAIATANFPVVCYYDVDLATDMQHLRDLVVAIHAGADVATGSRLMPQSNIERTGGREIASRTYNLFVRIVLKSRVHDHQCGFKAFNTERILAVLPSVRDGHWFWDTELLVRCQRLGYRITEFPVRWRAGKRTTVRFRDVILMGSSILRLWWQLHVS